ncbi:MAG TPA: hypothetical protein VJV04_13515 [Nitrospiraceae bacterium]|nr:hypothetical protein [Nitrospiraceae bacterium]
MTGPENRYLYSPKLGYGWSVAGILAGAMLLVCFSTALFAEEGNEPKSTRMTCGACPDGYATTGVTTDPKICKDGDPTVVQCVPLGANILSVCGSCPDGYRQVGSSSSPARCGNTDGGRMAQCQLDKMQNNMPDPSQGGITCPPNCGSTVAPGQGAIPPPPKFRPSPEKKSE